MRPPGTVRVASFNIRDLLDDRDAAARVVRAIDPDVLCLQEVPRRLLGSERVSDFARRCGLYWSGHHRGSGGTTIFTSLRVVADEFRHTRLPVPVLVRTRGYAVVRVRVPGHLPLTAVSVHLSLDPAERERHASTILADVAGLTPLVICGDLNEGEEGSAWRQVATGLRLVSPTSPTFPAARPRRLLDVVFASTDADVLAHPAVEVAEADLVAGSDHRPVWADLRLPPG